MSSFHVQESFNLSIGIFADLKDIMQDKVKKQQSRLFATINGRANDSLEMMPREVKNSVECLNGTTKSSGQRQMETMYIGKEGRVFKNGFFFMGARLYNSLPKDIRESADDFENKVNSYFSSKPWLQDIYRLWLYYKYNLTYLLIHLCIYFFLIRSKRTHVDSSFILNWNVHILLKYSYYITLH